LGISQNTAGIVVDHGGDEARAEDGKKNQQMGAQSLQHADI
jgi:hypothetical protein